MSTFGGGTRQGAKVPLDAASREAQRAVLAASRYPSGSRDAQGSAMFVGTQQLRSEVESEGLEAPESPGSAGPLSPGRTKGLAGFWSNQSDDVKGAKKKRFVAEESSDVNEGRVDQVTEASPQRLDGVVRASDPGEWSKPIDLQPGATRNLANSFQQKQPPPTAKKPTRLPQKSTGAVEMREVGERGARGSSGANGGGDRVSGSSSGGARGGGGERVSIDEGVIVLAENNPEELSEDVVRGEVQAKDEPVFEAGRTKNLLKHWMNTEVEYNAPKTSTSRLELGAKPTWISEIEEAKGITVPQEQGETLDYKNKENGHPEPQTRVRQVGVVEPSMKYDASYETKQGGYPTKKSGAHLESSTKSGASYEACKKSGASYDSHVKSNVNFQDSSTNYQSSFSSGPTYEQSIKQGTTYEQSIKQGTSYEMPIKQGTTYELPVKQGTTYEQSIQSGTMYQPSIKQGTTYEESLEDFDRISSSYSSHSRATSSSPCPPSSSPYPPNSSPYPPSSSPIPPRISPTPAPRATHSTEQWGVHEPAGGTTSKQDLELAEDMIQGILEDLDRQTAELDQHTSSSSSHHHQTSSHDVTSTSQHLANLNLQHQRPVNQDQAPPIYFNMAPRDPGVTSRDPGVTSRSHNVTHDDVTAHTYKDSEIQRDIEADRQIQLPTSTEKHKESKGKKGGAKDKSCAVM